MKKIINIKIFLFGLIVSVLFIVFAFVLVNYFEKKTLEAVLKAKQDPAYWEAYYAGIKKRDADVEYTKERLSKSKNKIRKPVQTPLGVFETQTDAANAHGLGNTETIRTRIKSPNPKFTEYKSLTIEEYEQLKKP